ncbi:MAG: hypothetical protein IJO87_10425 [Eggerthellaceae bacterium]|nr:hypothetical protein [Eggerthellaceae bacterium]
MSVSQIAGAEGSELSERKPIGTNEGDFETVVVDGFLGFGLSMGCSILLIFFSLYGALGYEAASVMLVSSVIIIGVLLFLGWIFCDAMNSKGGNTMLLVGVVLGFALSLAVMALDLGGVGALFAGVALVSTLFLYGKFLGSLERRILMVLFSAVFAFAGFTVIMLVPLSHWFRFAPIAGAALLAVMVTVLFFRKKNEYNAFGDAAESKIRSIKVKGNNHSLILLGFMMGAIALIPGVGVQGEHLALAFGGSMGVAGILSLLLGQIDERLYKESMLKSCALVTAACFLFIPVLPSAARLVLVSVFLCHVWLNVIILVNAVIETSRFNLINPIWLLGYQGGVFFAGCLFGCFLYLVGAFMQLQYEHALYTALMVGVIASSYMQIQANYQAYPFEPVIEATPEEQALSQEITERSGQRKTLYQKKRQYACELYALSPREREILTTLLKGRDAKYIMDTFYISQSTAKTHIYNIYRKFDVHSRQELLDFIEDIELPPEELLDVIPDEDMDD